MGYSEILTTGVVREVNAYQLTWEEQAEPIATRAKAICLGRYWRAFEGFEHYEWHDTNAICEHCNVCIACGEVPDPDQDLAEWCRAGDHSWLLPEAVFNLSEEERFADWFWSDERGRDLETSLEHSDNALKLPKRSDFEKQIAPLERAIEQLRLAQKDGSPLHGFNLAARPSPHFRHDPVS